MNKKYIYIEKRQRLDTEGKTPKRAQRIIEELELMGVDFDFIYNEQIEVLLKEDETTILLGGRDIREYTNIIFGGHISRMEYELKTVVADYCINHNLKNEQKIYLQNMNFIKKMPHYTKMYMAKICIDNGLPHLATYYNSSGNYINNELPFSYPLIAKHYQGKNDIVNIDGERKIKKTVFKVENQADWAQARLKDKNLKEYLVQEFSDAGEDYRIFISNGEIIGGWKRRATTGFMTVSKGSEYLFYNQPSAEIVEICKKAYKAWGVDFMALDFIFNNGKPYVLEFSMHPGFNAYETKCLGDDSPANIAKAIIGSFPE